MKTKYLIRLDDACPTMDRQKWNRIEEILDKYEVRPMVGVIPANADPKQMIDSPDPDFWNKVKRWEDKGWAIALHGYDHCYISSEGGINPLWPRSEFAGVSLDIQKEKIKKGIEIFAQHGIHPLYFFAPSHTFDENTLRALRECSEITCISDTIAFRPYKKDDITFIPCQMGRFRKISLPGIWTFCFHPNLLTESDFQEFQSFLSKNECSFSSIGCIGTGNCSEKGIFDKFLCSFYFASRKMKGH